MGQPLVIFDDTCSLCRGAVRWVRALDWFRVFGLLGYYEAAVSMPHATEGGVDAGVRVAFPDGSVTVGIDAVRSIAIRTVLGFLPGLLLYVPGIHHLAHLAYVEVARRRPRTACSLHASGVRRTGTG